MSTALATVPKHKTLVEKFASKYLVDEDKLLVILKATAFKQRDNKEITNEQMTALLVVADQYGLNPFTKEIFAYPDKQNGIVPVVSVDGWVRIINEHGALDGIDFRYADKLTTMKLAKPCPEWCEVIVKRKDRAQPIIVREYLDEVFRELDYASPWKTHTKRMLRHKTLIQGARIAFGFAGIYDEDEAERIIDMGNAEIVQETPKIEGPKAKTESAAPAGAPETMATATSGSSGAAPDQVVGQPMKPSQASIIRAKLKNAGLTDLDLEAAHGGKTLEPKEGKAQFSFSEFSDLTAWIEKNAKA